MGNQLREWRIGKGYRLADVGGLTGYSDAYVSRLERGERRLSPDLKVTFARRLGVDVRELFPVERADLVA